VRPTAAEIVTHHSPDPAITRLERLPGGEHWASPKVIVEPDPRWGADFITLTQLIHTALGVRVIELHHVGSTAVTGLPAKPVIDVDLVVADPAAEDAYIADLEAAGFRFHAREPGWHQHRLLKFRSPFAHLHVFGPDCPEVIRHLMFRDWLIEHPEDRLGYAEVKRDAARRHSGDAYYTELKGPFVRAIYERAFRAHGLLT
jgi:GrpB-like predicted nucleotidyltransferase (UPF0157 family)